MIVCSYSYELQDFIYYLTVMRISCIFDVLEVRITDIAIRLIFFLLFKQVLLFLILYETFFFILKHVRNWNDFFYAQTIWLGQET